MGMCANNTTCASSPPPLTHWQRVFLSIITFGLFALFWWWALGKKPPIHTWTVDKYGRLSQTQNEITKTQRIQRWAVLAFIVFWAWMWISAWPQSAHADGGDQRSLEQPFSVAGGPFVGGWHAHGEGLTINSDGTGTEVYSGGTVGFRLGAVAGPPQTPQLQAQGVVTQPSGHIGPVGGYVGATLVDGGKGLLWSIANGDQQFPFCKMVNGSYANQFDCGA